jgi:hypothetical protein
MEFSELLGKARTYLGTLDVPADDADLACLELGDVGDETEVRAERRALIDGRALFVVGMVNSFPMRFT